VCQRSASAGSYCRESASRPGSLTLQQKVVRVVLQGPPLSPAHIHHSRGLGSAAIKGSEGDAGASHAGELICLLRLALDETLQVEKFLCGLALAEDCKFDDPSDQAASLGPILGTQAESRAESFPGKHRNDVESQTEVRVPCLSPGCADGPPSERCHAYDEPETPSANQPCEPIGAPCCSLGAQCRRNNCPTSSRRLLTPTFVKMLLRWSCTV
jgi:hypothetical protein